MGSFPVETSTDKSRTNPTAQSVRTLHVKNVSSGRAVFWPFRAFLTRNAGRVFSTKMENIQDGTVFATCLESFSDVTS